MKDLGFKVKTCTRSRGKQPGHHRLPDCLVIGPQKAGTTWIHRYFESRSDVGVPRGVKETFFFDRRYQRGIDWYARHFRRVGQVRRLVEVAPTYFHCIEGPSRIVRELGSIPLICTLRHPAERAFSLYMHLRRFGKTRGTFHQAVRHRPVILQSSLYATNLRRWIDSFGREKVLVLFLEDLARDADQYARQLCRHLDVPFHGIDQSLYRPVNEAALPRNSYVAQYAKGLSDLIRSMGFYGVVEAAKKLGLKEVFFGRPGTVDLPRLSTEDSAWFTAQIEQELDELEDLLGVSVRHWKTSQP